MMGFLLRETAENLSRDNLFTVYKLRGEKSANSSILTVENFPAIASTLNIPNSGKNIDLVH